MAEHYGWLSLLPPLTAIALALIGRQVHLALFVGIWFGGAVLVGGNPLAGVAEALDQVVGVLGSPDSAEVLLFTLLVGGLIRLMSDSGGVRGFGDWMVRRGVVRGPRTAQLFTAALGVSIFIESNITCLVTGTVSRPLYDRIGLSRAKLAYICDSTSAPICMLLPLNAWGALLLSLLAAQGVAEPLAVLIRAVPLNFYALLAIGLVVGVAVTGWNVGPMRREEARAAAGESPREEGDDGPGDAEGAGLDRGPGAAPANGDDAGLAVGGDGEGEPPARPVNLVLPVVVMVAMMPVGLTITGDGDWMAGSGSTSVLWAVTAALATAVVLARLQGVFTWTESGERTIEGMKELTGVMAILALALAIGNVCRELGTGIYVTETVAPWIGPATVAPLVFLAGALISFSTGSSWGTFAILVPIAIPMAQELGAPVALTTAAVMGGGVFGDHCSPISDTTVISSLSAGCDHILHVATQLPYALMAGGAATILYVVAGWLTV